MPPRPRVARKLLVASIGVATMSYVATSCGGTTTTAGNDGGGGGGDAVADTRGPGDAHGGGDAVEDFPVANLAQMPDVQMQDTSTQDVMDDFPVANLVVMPDASAG